MKVQSLTKKFMLLLVCFAMLFAISLLAGCSGSDGSAGPAGPAGPAGGVTSTDFTCVLCHNTGKIADIANPAYHPDMYGTKVVITNVALTSSATGTPIVTFHADTVLSDGTGTAAYNGLTTTSVRGYLADLVPAGTVTAGPAGTLSTPYFEQWAAYTGNSISGSGGDYTYTFSTNFSAPTATTMNNADIDLTPATGHTQRLVLRVSAPTSPIGVVPAVATMDFKVPANGAAATDLGSSRMMVTIEACKKCHGPAMAGAAHASSYMDTKACVICHSPLYGTGTADPAGFMLELQADLPEFIHKIHAAKAVAGFMTRIKGKGYVDVTYPQDIKKCDVCHTGTGDLINNWKDHPTAVACTSCHTNSTLNADGSITHGAGAVAAGAPTTSRTDAQCGGCHGATDIAGYHDTTPTGINVPEFVVNLSVTPPANGTHYVSRETFTVTVTLNDKTTGTPVSSAVYTTAKQAAGTTGGGLSTASLYIYGPRAKALPLTGTQANSLFMSTTNTKVKTDATGFKYAVTLPSTITSPGTYGVRFRAGDYGRIDDTNYKIESIAFQTIQIGTATVEEKIDGNACVDCHGNGTAPFHDARHAVVFDTDQCVSCHDLSGGHADPISNRVHAIHAQSVHGDLLDTAAEPLDWSSVTYPLGNMGTSSTGASTGAKICGTCHTSASTAYKSNALGQACYGCHTGTSSLSLDHMIQMGAPAID